MEYIYILIVSVRKNSCGNLYVKTEYKNLSLIKYDKSYKKVYFGNSLWY